MKPDKLEPKLTYEELEQEIQKLREQVCKSETGLRESQELALIGSWEWDLHQQTLKWSEEVFHIFGLNDRN